MKSISHHPDNKGILHSYVLPVTWVMEVIPEERDGWWEPRRGTWRNIFQKMGTSTRDLEKYILKNGNHVVGLRRLSLKNLCHETQSGWLDNWLGVFRPQINPPDYQMEQTNPPDYQMEQASPSCSPDYLPQIPPFSKLHWWLLVLEMGMA